MDVLSETIAAIRTGDPTSGMFVRQAPWGRAYPVVPGTRETDTPLASVARKVGYQSEFAFAKAFKREYGLAPGRYRHHEDTSAVVAV